MMNVSLGYTPKYDTRFMVWITIRLRIHKQLVERTVGGTPLFWKPLR